MFKVTIPAYNCERWIKQCLDSLISQTFTEWETVVVNDGSTDRTKQILDSITDPRVKIIHNEINKGSALASIILATENLNASSEDIIVNLDGDDLLSDPFVLKYLSEIYSNNNILMTYGQFAPMSKTYKNYCKPLIDTENYRKSGYWLASHLRTYKKKLFDQIKDEDLRDGDGNYYRLAGDTALLYPLIELAGLDRIKFIERILYIYNDLSELNEMKKDPTNQIAIANKIRAKQEYKRANI